MSISEIDAVVSEIRIAAPPSTVFAFFVDPERMVRWMGVNVEADPRPGGPYAVDISPHIRARGEFVEVTPHSRVVFTFGWADDAEAPPASGTVEVTLTADGEGTHVRLVHRGLRTAELRERHADGWAHYFRRLGIAASGGDPGPDPNTNPSSGGA